VGMNPGQLLINEAQQHIDKAHKNDQKVHFNKLLDNECNN
jgi:hypothetical protein